MMLRTLTATLAMSIALPVLAQSSNDQVDRYKTKDGTRVELHSGMLERKPDGTPPTFAEIDRNGDGALDENEASAYRLLGDDFKYADSNHDGRVSPQEYARWTAQR